MSTVDEVNRELLAAIDDKRMLVLATVVRTASGSSVGVGAKLLVDEDRQLTGTLGDPDLDRRVVDDALAAMDERKSRVADSPPADGSAPSGDALGVFLEVVEPQ